MAQRGWVQQQPALVADCATLTSTRKRFGHGLRVLGLCLDECAVVRQSGSLEIGYFCAVVPAAHAQGLAEKGFLLERRDFCDRHRAALQLQRAH